MSSKTSRAAVDVGQQLESLRRSYVIAYPRQRLHVAKLRINNPGHDPNRLIAFVSAAEGLARSLCMHHRVRRRSELAALYPNYIRRGPESLVGEFLAAKGLGKPRDYFGAETWEHFEFAVQYRNVLAHECTYLGADLSPKLIKACRTVLRALAKEARLDPDDI